jgi:hypothetical protein
MTYTATTKTIPIADLAVAGILDPVDPEDAANTGALSNWRLESASVAANATHVFFVWTWVEATP